MTDWSIIDDERVTQLAEAAATKVAAESAKAADSDDLYQEALIALADNAEEIRVFLLDPLVGERQVYRWIYLHLKNVARPAVRTAARMVPLAGVVATLLARDEG